MWHQEREQSEEAVGPKYRVCLSEIVGFILTSPPHSVAKGKWVNLSVTSFMSLSSGNNNTYFMGNIQWGLIKLVLWSSQMKVAIEMQSTNIEVISPYPVCNMMIETHLC